MEFNFNDPQTTVPDDTTRDHCERRVERGDLVVTGMSAGLPHGPEESGQQPIASICYSKLNLEGLKAECRARKLKVKGRKDELISRLMDNDRKQQGRTSEPPSEDAVIEPDVTEMLPIPIQDDDSTEINPIQLYTESAELGEYFDRALRVDIALEPENEDDSEDEGENQAENSDDEDASCSRDDATSKSVYAWVDNFILKTRRKGGRETEKSVVKHWKVWASDAIRKGIVPDLTVDANHVIEYLKYAATRNLLSTRGKKKSTADRLSASSLKKIMTMLGRIRRRQEDEDPSIREARPAKTSRTEDFYKAVMIQSQRLRLESEDFDITKGTILDSELRPEQFDEITKAIFSMNQLPSIIKAHFSWTWQCSTLARSDEVVSLPMAHLQPYDLRLPNFFDGNGRLSPSYVRQFGILSLLHEHKTAKPGKTEPTYSFALPHRNPLRCPVGALAILFHFTFDQENLVSKVAGWDWGKANSWHQLRVMFGRSVDVSMTGDALGRMYTTFLDDTSITSKKKTHLARRTMPALLEEMGVPADQVDASGNWQGNTRREVYGSKIPKAAAVALAGFPVGESYIVPWAQVPVPDSLQCLIFPFCEDVLAKLRLSGCKNQGILNFLNLLQRLRPFFWRAICAINAQFPESGIIKRLRILSSKEAVSFLHQWPVLLREEEQSRENINSIAQSFNELPTQNAFSTMSTQLHGLHRILEQSNSQLSVISRRTESFSPTKRRRTEPVFPIPGQNFTQGFPPHYSLPLQLPNPHVESYPPSPPLTTPTSFHVGSILSAPPPTQSVLSIAPLAVQPSSISPARDALPESPRRTTTSSGLSCSQNIFQTSQDHHLLTPRSIKASSGRLYCVLPLSLPSTPDQLPPHTQHDLILPPREAFTSSVYPSFTTSQCTWQYVLDQVVNPSTLWACYAPGNLGDYPDIKSIWQAWDEGAYVKGIGRKPALRMIDAKWGNLESQDTRRRKLPSWRPRNDGTARKIWANYYFFIKRIEDSKRCGKSTDQALADLEDQRDGKSLSQLHKALQPKKARKNHTLPRVKCHCLQ